VPEPEIDSPVMILLTGASGLLGQHVLNYLLKKNLPVRALCRQLPVEFISENLRSEPEWRTGDILDFSFLDEAFQGITHVYHCAGLVSYQPGDRDKLLQVNAQGTKFIVDLCLHYQVRKLCFVSSIAAIGDSKEVGAVSEDDVWDPANNLSSYALSKREAEMEVWRGMAEGLNAVILNPGIILGEGKLSSSSNRLFELAMKEFPWYSTGVTAFVDVNDVVQAMVKLMDQQEITGRYIIAENNYAFREIMDMMADAFHCHRATRKAKRWQSALLWRWQWLVSKLSGRSPVLTKESVFNAFSVKYFDNSSLLHVLPGFTYQPVRETIQRIAHYHLSKLNRG